MPNIDDNSKNWRPGSTPPHIATLILLAGTSVATMNIFLPVLPAIGDDLNSPPAVTQYVLTFFLAATAIVQLLVGPLSDRFGRRPVLLYSSLIFLLATMVCIFATTIEILLLGRILQASSAAYIALSRAIIRDMYDRAKAASMIGYVTMAMAVIPMVTPTIGGLAGQWFGWRATFIVLLILGLVMLLTTWIDLGETNPARKTSPTEQMQLYWALLKEPAVWGYIFCATFCSGTYFAFLGGAPFVGNDIIGMSPAELGFHFGFVALGYMSGNYLSGRYSVKVGIEPMMLYGGLVSCFGVAVALLLMKNFEPRAIFLFLPMIFVGMGNGMTLPNASAGAVSVRPHLAGSASGLSGFISIGGGAALASLSGSLISLENQALPLYLIMFTSSLAGAIMAGVMYLRSRNHEN